MFKHTNTIQKQYKNTYRYKYKYIMQHHPDINVVLYIIFYEHSINVDNLTILNFSQSYMIL